MTYYAGARFFDELKEIHYQECEDLAEAQALTSAMAAEVVPYYLFTHDVIGMIQYTRKAIHLTQHVTEENFANPDTVMRLENQGSIVRVDLFISKYLPTTLDENGVHPESGFRYVKHDDLVESKAGEQSNGEAASNEGN